MLAREFPVPPLATIVLAVAVDAATMSRVVTSVLTEQPARTRHRHTSSTVQILTNMGSPIEVPLGGALAFSERPATRESRPVAIRTEQRESVINAVVGAARLDHTAKHVDAGDEQSLMRGRVLNPVRPDGQCVADEGAHKGAGGAIVNLSIGHRLLHQQSR